MGTTLVSGVPGVGLSTITERARKRLDENYELVNFGDVMLEHAAANDWATRRADLRGLSQRQTRRLQRRAGEFVADLTEPREVLLTTHLAVETDAGFLNGLPEAVLRDVNPDRFVLVEAAPETIRSRRDAADRDYGDASLRTIDFAQDANRTAAFEYAHAVDAPIRLVENEDDVEEAAADLAEVL
ncbi:MAG: adenylate kinase [Halanaeroarchaeum sp.]